MKNKDKNTEKPKVKKKAPRIIFWTALIAAALTAVYFRANPKWKAAELKIEPAGRFYEIQSLVPDGKTLETRITAPDGYSRVPVEKGSFGE